MRNRNRNRYRKAVLLAAGAMLFGVWGASSGSASAATGTDARRGGPVNGLLLTGANQGLVYYLPCTLTLTDPATGKVTIAGAPDTGCFPSATPSGSLIAYFGPVHPTTVHNPSLPEFLHVRDGDGSHDRIVATAPQGILNVFGPATFTPDGRLLFFGQMTALGPTEEYSVRLNGTGFAPYNTGIKGVTATGSVAYSADGSTSAIGTNDGIWLKRGHAAPTRLALPEIPSNYYGSLSLSPDGRRLAFNGADVYGDVYVVDTDGRNLREIAAPFTNAAGNVFGYGDAVFSPDGRQLAMNEGRLQGGSGPADWSTDLVTANLSGPLQLHPASGWFTNGGDGLVWLPRGVRL